MRNSRHSAKFQFCFPVNSLTTFQQAARDFAQLSHTKLTMPVLAIGGEEANGGVHGLQMKIVAADAAEIVLKDTGHWVLEERPKEPTDALLKFLSE